MSRRATGRLVDGSSLVDLVAHGGPTGVPAPASWSLVDGRAILDVLPGADGALFMLATLGGWRLLPHDAAAAGRIDAVVQDLMPPVDGAVPITRPTR